MKKKAELACAADVVSNKSKLSCKYIISSDLKKNNLFNPKHAFLLLLD